MDHRQLGHSSLSVPAPHAADEGRVLGVIAHGYRIGDEILRPALVAVGKTPTSA